MKRLKKEFMLTPEIIDSTTKFIKQHIKKRKTSKTWVTKVVLDLVSSDNQLLNYVGGNNFSQYGVLKYNLHTFGHSTGYFKKAIYEIHAELTCLLDFHYHAGNSKSNYKPYPAYSIKTFFIKMLDGTTESGALQSQMYPDAFDIFKYSSLIEIISSIDKNLGIKHN